MPTTLRRQKNRPTTSDTKPKTGPLYIDCIDLHIDLYCQKLSIFSLCTVQGTRIYSTLVIFSVPLDFCTVHGARCFIHPCLTAPAGLVPGGIFTHRVGPRWDLKQNKQEFVVIGQNWIQFSNPKTIFSDSFAKSVGDQLGRLFISNLLFYLLIVSPTFSTGDV